MQILELLARFLIFLASFNSVLETMVIETDEEIAQKERENRHS